MSRGWLLIAAACAGGGCSRPLDLGTNIIWSSDFESGDLSSWSSPLDGGGLFSNSNSLDAGDAQPPVQISAERAHSGRYSAKLASVANLTNPGPLPASGGGLYRQAEYPAEAYYSVWYYLPQAHQTITSWTILKFRGVVSPGAGNNPGYAELLDLSLQSLPGGDAGGDGMTLVLSDARHQYGTSPRPDPVPIVPIGRWFQIECFYRNTNAPNGELTIWLDGAMIYDVIRPMGPNSLVYFSACSIAYELNPSNADIYVDDVAISWTRLTPNGVLQVAN